MTDNEILKVLECCHNGTCSMCPYVNEGYCGRRMISGSLDLIRKQQAEIKYLKNEICDIDTVNRNLIKEKAEAIKEFADKLENRFFNYYEVLNRDSNKRDYRGETLMVYEVADMIEDCIDGTLKEMVGAE